MTVSRHLKKLGYTKILDVGVPHELAPKKPNGPNFHLWAVLMHPPSSGPGTIVLQSLPVNGEQFGWREMVLKRGVRKSTVSLSIKKQASMSDA